MAISSEPRTKPIENANDSEITESGLGSSELSKQEPCSSKGITKMP